MIYVVSSVAVVVVIVLLRKIAVTKRKCRRLVELSDKKVTSWTALADKLSEGVSKPEAWRQWLQSFCDLTQREFDAAGAVIYNLLEIGAKEERYHVLCGSGECASWCRITNKPGEGEEASQKADFKASIRKHFLFGSQSHLLETLELRACLPPDHSDVDFETALTAPLKSTNFELYMLVFRNSGKTPFRGGDKKFLDRCVDIIDAGLEIVDLKLTCAELEQATHRAHEDGMLQVSTGVIHNIGNAIAVVRLALDKLKDVKAVGEMSEFMKNDVLPSLKAHVEKKDVQGFLAEDPRGKELLGVIEQLSEQSATMIRDYATELNSIIAKFQNITDIITIQQQFIGELGTENVVPINAVMNDVVKMCQHTVEENGIELTVKIGSDARILVDAALLRHILLLVVKYATESIIKVYRTPARLKVVSEFISPSIDDSAGNVKVTISDNGYGINFDPDKGGGTSIHSQKDQTTKDLLFCKQRIEKYKGSFSVRSTSGKGSVVTISLPVYSE